MIPREMSENPQHPGSAQRSLHNDEMDLLVREEPLLIQVGEQQLLTMRTPGQDLALATGFLLSEGIVDEPAAIEAREPPTSGWPVVTTTLPSSVILTCALDSPPALNQKPLATPRP